MTGTLFSQRVSAALGVTGPLAASITNLQFKVSTFSLLMAPPSAAGIRKSHSKDNNSSLVIFLPWPQPSMVLLLKLWSNKLGISSPSGSCIPPVTSLTPTILQPYSSRNLAANDPTLPKP